MAVLVDTADVPVRNRAEFFESALNSAVFPSHIELRPGAPEPHARVERWVLGAGVDVVQVVSSGHAMRRSHAQIRKGAPEQLSLSMVRSGAIDVGQGMRRYTSLHDVLPIDALAPYRATFGTTGSAPNVSMCAQVDLNNLGMPVDVVRAALPRLTASPIYDLFRDHLAGVASAAAWVEDTPAAALLGSATSELARALLASAAPDDRWTREGLAAILYTRIDAYIRQNLSDHDLSARRIAAAHSISVRYLYRLFAERGASLEQQIIHERLEQTRRELARSAGARRTVETIAYGAGFSHPQYFSRRFREAYGVTPREWRQLHNPQPSP